MPSLNHAIAQANLIGEFSRNRVYRVASELNLELGGKPYTPDLSIYLRKQPDFHHDIVRVAEPPVLVVEILSPTQGYQSVIDKVDAYLQNGVKSCWVVSPPLRLITIFSPDGTQQTVQEGTAKDPATGLTADLAAVFS